MAMYKIETTENKKSKSNNNKREKNNNQNLLSLEEGNVEDWWEVVDKLQGKQFDGDGIVIVGLGTKALPICQLEGQPSIQLVKEKN